MPGIPPILDTLSSRMIYYDLAADVTGGLLLTGDTGWQVVSAAIEANRRGFPDTALVGGLWLVDTHCADGASQFDDDNDRSPVSLGQVEGREGCVEADSNHAITLFYRDAVCRAGRNEYEELAPHKPSTFQPRCLVVLIEAESRAKLRDELLESGRPLTDPLLVTVNYTTSRSTDPDMEVTSSSCALGRELLTLYEHDLVGQVAADALTLARADLTRAQANLLNFERVLDGMSLYQSPQSPPPPPPPDYVGAPPGAPATVTYEEQKLVYQALVAHHAEDVAAKAAAIDSCVPSFEVVCGRDSQQAPNPWLANGGEPCFGYDTYEALEGAYCAYWGSHNVDAAEPAEQAELLTKDGAPYCFSRAGKALKCPVTAARTIRAGVYELEEWSRPDRPYCKSDIFKQLILDNATTSEALCRQEMAERADHCKHESCPQCTSPCNYPIAKTVATVFRCTDATRHYGFLHYYHTSDAGQLARSMHGAVRKDNYIAVPEKLAMHLYHIGHYNPKGYLQRDSVSCRATHRCSPTAQFVAGFGEDGMPVTREGYMLACRKHTDCLACGRHPLTGQHYRCQRIHTLYDTVMTDNATIRFLNLSSGTGSAFDIDMEEGAMTGKTGVCVDLDSSMNEGCSHPKIAAAKDGIIGCSDGFISKFMCGLSVDVSHGDLSTVAINGNPVWPRVLLDGSDDRDGDGIADAGMTCSDPNDCTQKCRYLERTSRHGAGAPPACAMCDQYCSNNIVTTVTDLVQAIWDDVETILALIGRCLGGHGLSGCICQFAMTLQPEWRKNAKDALASDSSSDEVRSHARDIACLNGDPFAMILQQLNTVIINWIETGVNSYIVNPVNSGVHEVNNVIKGVDDFYDTVSSFMNIGDDAKEFAEDVGEGASNLAGEAGDWLGGAAETVGGGLNDVTGGLAGDAWSGAASVAAPAVAVASEVAGSAWDMAKDAGSSVWSSLGRRLDEQEVFDLPIPDFTALAPGRRLETSALDNFSQHVYSNTGYGRRLRALHEAGVPLRMARSGAQPQLQHRRRAVALEDRHTGRSDHMGLPYIPYVADMCLEDPRTPNKPCMSGGSNEEVDWSVCEDPALAGGRDMLCYYKRVNQICTSGSDTSRYKGLFTQGYEDLEAANAHFSSAFGDSYAYLDPTTHQLLQQAAASTFESPDMAPRRDICVSDAFASSMSLDMIVQSCIWSMVESFCPDDEEEDEGFAFLMETTSFSLPKVRFSYDVEPPPPPPMAQNAFERIVQEDPEGVEEVRRKLEDWFPRLADVATSSMGATVGPYMGEMDVTSQQLTRAYLASAHMEPDSLGARVIESKHTGRWRYGCKMLHDYLHEHTSPGTNSQGYKSGREGQRTGHLSAYDRNSLMYAMLQIKLSMGGSDPHGLSATPYDTIAMHDRICGGGSDNQMYDTGAGPAGWRAATFDTSSPTYDVAVDANAFAPVVAIGSLEMLQSMRATTMASCPAGFNTEDLTNLLACELGDDAMKQDLVTRGERVPFAMQRNVWCDASLTLSVESAVGNPFHFSENLYDTSIKQRFMNGRGYQDMKVPAAMRGEERMDADFRRKTLMGWVYVTSSGGEMRAGMYRLLDLPVFRSTSCLDLPDVTCTADQGIYTATTVQGVANTAEGAANDVANTVESAANDVANNVERAANNVFSAFSNWFGRRLGSYHHVHINEEYALIDAASEVAEHSVFLTGREGLPLHRCSEMVKRVTGKACLSKVYASMSDSGCTTQSLPLVSEPVAYGAEHWVRKRLVNADSPSPPPPPPLPGTPPPPPQPRQPPQPPIAVSQFALMNLLRDVEERMCTSVYYLSQAARCERLALDLTQRVYYNRIAPPLTPTMAPYPPPPPPPPPRPSLPDGLFSSIPTSALLSTNRVPEQSTGLATGDDFYVANLTHTIARLATVARDQRACVVDAPLACNTGSLPERCASAGRHCGSADENGRDPWVEFVWPHMPDRYLWAIEITLPPSDQLSRLIVGKRELKLYGERGEPVSCAQGDAEITDVTTAETITIVCQPGAWDEADLHALGGVHRARLTLVGSFRQLWLAGIAVVERSYGGAGVGRRPPPPPHPPSNPPLPGVQPSTSTCTFARHKYVERESIIASALEPCAWTSQQCCDALVASTHKVYEMDDAGCCLLHTVSGIPGALLAAAAEQPWWQTPGHYTTRAGTGYAAVV